MVAERGHPREQLRTSDLMSLVGSAEHTSSLGAQHVERSQERWCPAETMNSRGINFTYIQNLPSPLRLPRETERKNKKPVEYSAVGQSLTSKQSTIPIQECSTCRKKKVRWGSVLLR